VSAKRGLGWLERFRRSSQRTRVRGYLRYSMYSLGAIETMVIAAVLTQVGGAVWARLAVAAVCCAHVVLCLLLTGMGVRYYLGAAERPDRLIGAFIAVTLVAIGTVTALNVTGRLPDEAAGVTVYLATYTAGPVGIALPWRSFAAVMAVPMLIMPAGVAARGGSPAAQATVLVICVALAAFIGGSYRATAWVLKVFDKLDAAMETEARLAVAEERLRFGRDLHDVLGRNLSVIALKSELAAQLAQRGAASAVDQMVEVQRIAHESQREMREMVRGYREADLHGELAGARGVLEAAGIRCRIEDGESAGLPPAVQSTLGWVVREGATNVLRHADAARCTVRLRRAAGGVAVLDMENDGARPPRRDGDGDGDGDAHGHGLAGLRERLAALGGSLTARSSPGGTFRLTAEVPVGDRP
jgi:two-component system, NarL family, sensor histidine kinase DesK